MNEKDVENFEQFENDTKLELIRLKESAKDSKAKSIINSISEELEKWLAEAKAFIEEHKDSEKLKDIIANVKEETTNVLSKVKEKANDIKDDDKMKDFVDASKENLKKAKEKMNDNETYTKVKENVINTFETIKNDENLKEGVKKVKNTTLQIAKKALSKIEEVLDKDDDEIVVHSIKKEDEGE